MAEPTVRFAYPPVDAPITGGFGDWYGLRQHRGTDFGCNVGTPVRAPAPGRIVAPYNDGSYGIAVCIQHEDGWHTLYAHLERAAVEPGQYVETGTVLGYSGNTGMSTGPHLHWQLSDSYRFLVDISHSRDAMELIAPEVEDALKLTEKQTEDLLLRVFAGSEYRDDSRQERLERCMRELAACDTSQSVNDLAASAIAVGEINAEALTAHGDTNHSNGGKVPEHTHTPGPVSRGRKGPASP